MSKKYLAACIIQIIFIFNIYSQNTIANNNNYSLLYYGDDGSFSNISSSLLFESSDVQKIGDYFKTRIYSKYNYLESTLPNLSGSAQAGLFEYKNFWNYAGYKISLCDLSADDLYFRNNAYIYELSYLNILSGTISFPIFISGQNDSSAFIVEPIFTAGNATSKDGMFYLAGQFVPCVPSFFSFGIKSRLFYNKNIFLQYGLLNGEVNTANGENLFTGKAYEFAGLFYSDYIFNNFKMAYFAGLSYLNGDFSGKITQEYNNVLLAFPYSSFVGSGNLNILLLGAGFSFDYKVYDFAFYLDVPLLTFINESFSFHADTVKKHFFYSEPGVVDCNTNDFAGKALISLNIKAQYDFKISKVKVSTILQKCFPIYFSFSNDNSESSSDSNSTSIDNDSLKSYLLSFLSLSVKISY